MKSTLTPIILVLLAILTGCASQPQLSASELKEALQAARGNTPTRPALDLAGNPTVAIAIEGDSFGLKDRLAQQLKASGINLIDDPTQAQVVISGEVLFVGDPEDAPDNATLNNLRKQATVGGTVASVAAVGLKMASPMSLVSSGVGFLASGASKLMAPNKLQGIAVLRIKQNGRLWEVNLSKIVEGSKDALPADLAQALTREALKSLTG